MGDREFVWRGNSDKTILPTVAGKVIEMEFQSEIVISGERQLVSFAQQCSCSFGPNNNAFSRELLGGGNQPFKELSWPHINRFFLYSPSKKSPSKVEDFEMYRKLRCMLLSKWTRFLWIAVMTVLCNFRTPRDCCNQGKSLWYSISCVSILTHQVSELFV